jgi:diguanylate cyclase (GGDEF)-like protein
VVVLTVVFALLNLCLGFAAAVYWKSGMMGFVEVWESFVGSRAYETTNQLPNSSLINVSGANKAHSSLPEQKLITPVIDEVNNNASTNSVDASLPAKWDIDEKFVETSILRLNFEMTKSNMKAVEIDTILRECQGNSSSEIIEKCTKLLLEDSVNYLAEQTEAAEKIHNRISEFGNLSALGEEIEMSNLEQSAQVETTINNLQYMDFHSDPDAANLRLIEELKNLYLARFKLRDNQESAFLTIARHENRLDKIDKRLFIDHLTKLPNRIGTETTLFDWWRQGRHQNRKIISAMFDIDSFSVLNQKFGLMAGDRILCHLAQFIQSSIGQDDIIGRVAGQQFLVMMMDVGANVALKAVDMWQQTIEKMAFQYHGKPVSTTISSTVALVDPTVAHHKVFEQQEKLMKQVKQIGPNRIIFHNGTSAAPFEPHSLGLQETKIDL